jgi:GNAT superfamily N-acetyltransferase
MKFSIIKARDQDIPFLVDSVINAEKLDTNIISYCTLFNINERVLKEQIKEAFQESMGIIVWDINQWLVAVDEKGNAIAALAHWIENILLDSETQKFKYLSFLNKSNLNNPNFEIVFQALKKIQIHREANVCQFDFLYTKPEFQGKGIMSSLIKNAISHHPNSKFQIQVLECNDKAKRLYEKLGFIQDICKTEKGLKQNNILADDTKINLTYHGTKPDLFKTTRDI